MPPAPARAEMWIGVDTSREAISWASASSLVSFSSRVRRMRSAWRSAPGEDLNALPAGIKKLRA